MILFYIFFPVDNVLLYYSLRLLAFSLLPGVFAVDVLEALRLGSLAGPCWGSFLALSPLAVRGSGGGCSGGCGLLELWPLFVNVYKNTPFRKKYWFSVRLYMGRSFYFGFVSCLARFCAFCAVMRFLLGCLYLMHAVFVCAYCTVCRFDFMGVLW